MFSISRIGHVLKALPRASFDKAVCLHRSDRYSKGFSSWDHLVAMLYVQLSGCSSLRQVEAGFNAQLNHHYHLGTQQIRRSTLAEANGRRNPQVFADLARVLMAELGRSVRQQRQELLYLLDSTSVSLSGPGFDDWTADNRTRRTQGIKLHLLLEHSAQAPAHCSVSAPNLNDIEAARQLRIESSATYVFDKGYCDYNWWYRIDQAQARWVTRFKHNAAVHTVVHQRIAPEAQGLILHDSIVRFANRFPRAGHRNHYDKPLRRIVVARPDKSTPLVLATNDLHSSATEVAQLYRQRWQVELFFKWIKQHLLIKKFLGTSQNAVRIQLYTALIAYMLLLLHRKRTGTNTTLWMLLVQLRCALFERPAITESLWRRRRAQHAAFHDRQTTLFT